METSVFPQAIEIARPSNQRRWLWFGLGLVAIAPAVAPALSLVLMRALTVQPALPNFVFVGPAVAGVAGYLSAHAASAPWASS
jgi:hypothetical protein